MKKTFTLTAELSEDGTLHISTNASSFNGLELVGILHKKMADLHAQSISPEDITFTRSREVVE